MQKQKHSILPDVMISVAVLVCAYEMVNVLSTLVPVLEKTLAFPFPITYREGPVLEQVLRLANGENIYTTAINAPPYAITQTPPLYLLAQLPFVQATGPTFWYGRAIALGGVLASALFIGLIVYVLGKDWLAGVLAGLLLFCFPHTLMAASSAQADALALALSLAAVLLLVVAPQRTEVVMLAAALCITAIFTQHRFFVAVPLLGVIWLWRAKALRNLGMWAGLLLGCGASGFAALNVRTNGGFAFHILTTEINFLSFTAFFDQALNVSIRTAFLLIGGVLLFIVDRTDTKSHAYSFAMLYFCCACLSALTAMRTSQSITDSFEVVAALCILTGVTVAWAGRNFWLKAIAIGVVALQIGTLSNWTNQLYLPKLLRKTEASRDVFELAQIVRTAKGNVLADEFMGLIPFTGNGQRIYVQPYEFRLLKAAGQWRDDDLIRKIERREFAAVLLYETDLERSISVRWTPELRKAIYANYEQKQLLADTLVYRPK